MPILAFLQNQWFPDPKKIEANMERAKANGIYWDYRRRLIPLALFARCKTGRVLQSVFGEDLCDEIIWDESSTVIAGDAKAVYPADPAHMQAVIDHYQPSRILVFGKIAQAGIRGCRTSAGLLYGPHPAARQPDTIAKLKAMHTELVNALNLKL